MTKPTKWLCTQRRLRSAWASAQSDQSLCCPHEESLASYLPIERIAKTLISLGGCPGWSESSLGAQSFCWLCQEVAHFFFLTANNQISQNLTQTMTVTYPTWLQRSLFCLNQLTIPNLCGSPSSSHSWPHRDILYVLQQSISIKAYMTNGLFHPYQLDETISKFRGVWCIFLFWFLLNRITWKQTV